MMECPEAIVIADEMNTYVCGKRIMNVTAAHSPHKFAWYHGDPQGYPVLLEGQILGTAAAFGSMVEISAADRRILLGEGVSVRYHGPQDAKPVKHQLFVEFEDFSAISVSIQLYGGIWCYREGEFDNPYFMQAKIKPSPLTEAFDASYFDRIVSGPEQQKFSAKALLATEQRIPGLGNGVLQDILYNARIHPKKKVKTFSTEDKERLYSAIKSTLAEMTFKGGRDTERDLLGCPGGYITKLSKNTAGQPCPECGCIIQKEAYMGGNIYYCGGCQSR